MIPSSVVPGFGPVTGAVAVVAVPAQDPAPPPGQGPEFGKASPVALVVIVLLALATVLLIRSMSKRIRRLPVSFDEPGRTDGPTDPADGTPDAGPAAAESRADSRADSADADAATPTDRPG